MIPKKINYIWIGGNPKSNFTSICLHSWKEHLQGYEIIEWNESNLNIEELCSKNKFLEECRKRKLWAFMADYLRLYILYNYGGIYMDVDVQVLKSFDDVLDNRVFIGYEHFSQNSDKEVTEGTGIIGSEPKNSIIKECLDYYNEEIWKTDVYYIPTIFSIVFQKHHADEYNIYPVDFFAPYDYRKKYTSDCVTNNTVTIHWFQASWHENKNIFLFLQTKHIHNPFARMLKQLIGLLWYYKRKYEYILNDIKA